MMRRPPTPRAPLAGLAPLAAFAWMAAGAPAGQAALLPQAQNQRDLEVMVSFIRQYDRVAATLKSIDFQRRIVYFEGDCQAEFGRKPRPASPEAMTLVGAAEPLVFIRSNCSLKD